jgi:hypothetical protein
LQVTVTGEKATEKVAVSSLAVQDRSLEAELGYELSPMSDDDITATYKDGLLESVTANLKDESGQIIVQVAKLISQFRAATATQEEPTQKISFDPFQYSDAMRANNILRARGICAEVELQPGVWSPGCGKWSLGTQVSLKNYSISLPPGERLQGVYYRRPASHMVHVVENGKTTDLEPLGFANDQPVFRIDIRRSLFVERKTVIKFNQGALESVAVNKPSEVLEAVSLPFTIIEAFANSVTGGVASSVAKSRDAAATKSLADANLANVAAAQITQGESPGAAQAAGFARDAPLTPAMLSECANFKFTPEQCVRYHGY